MDRKLSISTVNSQIDQLPFLEEFRQLLLSKSANLDTYRLQEAVRNLELAEKEIFDLFQEPDLFGRVTKTAQAKRVKKAPRPPISKKFESSGPRTNQGLTKRVPPRFRIQSRQTQQAIVASSAASIPEFTMRELLEAGVHFGHQTQRWNPMMSQYIYGERNGIHIMDLTQTVPLIDSALDAIRSCAQKGGNLLFVGTKRQAQKWTKEAATHCGQFYMNHRWIGGTLTNWNAIERNISVLKQLEDEIEENPFHAPGTDLARQYTKLKSALGGIQEMNGLPDMIFVIDVNKEDLAVAEARKMNIPVVALVDTNCDPTGVDYIIPGNDDATASIRLICELVSRAVIAGSTHAVAKVGKTVSIADLAWRLEDELEAAFEHNVEVEFE